MMRNDQVKVSSEKSCLVSTYSRGRELLSSNFVQVIKLMISVQEVHVLHRDRAQTVHISLLLICSFQKPIEYMKLHDNKTFLIIHNLLFVNHSTIRLYSVCYKNLS
jgi:hypothetical protein